MSMLAKIWKKMLLAICIIACIYNIMHKLISRTSLEIQLKSVENQSSLLDIFTPEKNEEKSSTEQEDQDVKEEKENENEVETQIEEDDSDENNNQKVIEDEDGKTIVIIN